MSATNEVRLPQSMAYYLENEKNSQAVQSLLDCKKPSADMTWDELENYYQACMAAEQVRFDFWQLCKQVWLNTWGVAGIADKLNVSKIKHGWKGGGFSKEKVWEGGAIYQYFDKNGEYPEIYFSIIVECEDKNLSLYFYAEDESGGYDISSKLVTLGSDWKDNPDNDERSTIPGLSILPTDAGALIDLTKLQRAAKLAVTELAVKLENKI